MAKQYDVTNMPTFVFADVNENILHKQIGAPFSTPAKAMEWFDGVIWALKNVESLEKASAAKPEDADAALKLISAYEKLSRDSEVEELCNKHIEKLAKGDKRLVEFKLSCAGANMRTARTRDHMQASADMYEEILPTLLAAKDKRSIDATFNFAYCNRFRDTPLKGIIAYTKAIAAFPDDSDTARLCSALAGEIDVPTSLSEDDRKAVQKELEAIIKSVPAESEGALYAKAFLKTLTRGQKKPADPKAEKPKTDKPKK